jgi:helicase
MAVIARFIGANTYLDASISDLIGAGNDALALWALFSDTIAGIDAQLIVGAAATVQGIQQALRETLETATADDTVIFFYSGHGSHDHRLAAYDTSLTDLTRTTVPMQDLAEHFKRCQAKAIVCILDCCFSGGAPAKVLEDSPTPRTIGNPLHDLAGKGRVIIAASNVDEPSYELSSTGHGILTKALLDTLQSTEDNVNLIVAMDTVMELVRSEAARIGYVQTPVLLNHIEGGLVLPSLKPGANYFAAFPTRQGVTISKNIDDLALIGLPQGLLTEWKTLFTDGLNDLQLTAVNEYRILDGASLLVVAPTSSGKTFIGELASARALTDGKKAVFLLPYRALVNEKFDQFSQLYEEKLGYRVIRCTGDYQDHIGAFIKGKYDIALLTYEMFLNLTVSMPFVLYTIGLVVLDEGQFITDPVRGITVELLLTHLIIARNRGISPQLLVLSAVIGDTNHFEAWLDCKKLVTTTRPVPLIEGILDRSGVFRYADSEGHAKEEQLLSPNAIVMRKEKPSAQDMIVPLVRSLLAQGEKIIVFRNQRGFAEGCAEYLARELGLVPATDAIEKLPTQDTSTTSSRLNRCLAGGVAFHNTNLNPMERTVVERSFRDPHSNLRVLAATTTVAAGLNTPASTVILAEQEFVGEDGRSFTVAEYKNMAGRAGRVGFNEQGKAIILADTCNEAVVLYHKYVMGKLDTLSSSFDPELLDTWIIRLLTQVKGVTKDELVGLLANTYGGYIANRANPEWAKRMQLQINAVYARMVALGLLEEEGDVVHLTLLGKVCGQSVLTFTSAMRLVELLKSYQTGELTAENFMALVQALPESDAAYTPMTKRGVSEMSRPREATSRYGSAVVHLLQRFSGGDEFVYYARCKRACILFDWVRGVPVEDIERRYASNNPYYGNISYGDIRRFADLTRFQLRSAHQIASLIFPGQALDEKALDSLLKQLEVGIPVECLSLLELPLRLSRGEYLALNTMGVRNKADLLAQSDDALRQILAPSLIAEIARLRN